MRSAGTSTESGCTNWSTPSSSCQRIISTLSLAFAVLATVLAAIGLYGVLAYTVAQRTREFATLLTIGASRRQVLGSVILESLIIGLLASLIGLGLGVLGAVGN